MWTDWPFPGGGERERWVEFQGMTHWLASVVTAVWWGGSPVPLQGRNCKTVVETPSVLRHAGTPSISPQPCPEQSTESTCSVSPLSPA